MFSIRKISWKTLILYLLILVICLQIFLAIVAHQQSPSNTNQLQIINIKQINIQPPNQPPTSNEINTNNIHLQSLVDQIANSKNEQLVQTKPQERMRHTSRHNRHQRIQRIRELRRENNDESDGVTQRKFVNAIRDKTIENMKSKRFHRQRMRNRRRHYFRDADSKDDLIDFEKANLQKYMEDGGWIDINKISNHSFIYKSRTKNLNITQMLNSNQMVNGLHKYNFTNDKLINNKWNKKDIDILMENKRKLFDEYGIVSYESKMNYDLQLLEYDILKWIIEYQNPKKCPETYFEIGVLNKCGFGCKLDDYVLICAKFAMQQGYIFEFKNWGNDNNTLHEYGSWNGFFMPVSNVLSVCNDSELDILREGMYQVRPSKIGFWIPEEFEQRIEALHNDSVLFFHGVLNRYLLRLNKKYMKEYNEIRSELMMNDIVNIDKRLPLIGCHVRRTDKIMESNVYEWDNYVDLFKYLLGYNKIRYMGKGNKLDLFLATDDVNIVKTVMMGDDDDNGLKFNFLYNKYSMNIINNSVVLKQRRTDNALRSIVFDVLLLSESDLFIGQDGSRVSRLVLELIAMRLPDYKQRLISIDAVNNNLLDFPYWITENWLH
eukprot:391152_1